MGKRSMKKGIMGSKLSKEGQKPIICAFLTASYVTETEEIESTTKIVSIWEEMHEEIGVDSELDTIPALLTVGRITELKRPVTDIDEIKQIYNAIKEETLSVIKKKQMRIRNKDIVTAYMASALIAVSPKVERIKDVVNTWLAVREGLDVIEDEDVIAVILGTGRIRDLDAMHMIKPDTLSELTGKIKARLIK